LCGLDSSYVTLGNPPLLESLLKQITTLLSEGAIIIFLAINSNSPGKVHNLTEMGPDPIQPKHTFDAQWIEADPSLTQVLFDPTRRVKIEKFGIFRGNFPNLDSNQKWLTWPDPSNKNWPLPDPGQTFLNQSHNCNLNYSISQVKVFYIFVSILLNF